MKSIKQRIAAFLLAVMMTVSGMPIQAFAETTNSPPEEVESVLRLDDNNKTQPLETEETTIKEQTEPEDNSSTTQDQPAIKEDAPEETEALDVSEDKTSEDMDKQGADDSIPKGDPEGTVISKDGKTRITRFEVKWKDTDKLVIEDNIKRYRGDKGGGNSYKEENWTYVYDSSRDTGVKENFQNKDIKLDWSISGERTYKPGQIKINLPEIATLKENMPIGYEIDTDKTPVPKLIRKDDGSIDVDVDYGKSDYAWEIVDGVFSLVNIKELLPGTTGTSTISYKTDPQGNLRLVENGAIANIKPNITIDISENETIKKEDKTLSIKLNKDVNIGTFKDANYYSSWNEEWGDNIKPKNPDNYEYILYRVTTTLYAQYAAGKLKLEDTIGENQEILGFRNSKERLHRNSSDDPSYLKEDSVYGGFEKYDKSMNGVFEMDYPVEDSENKDKSAREQSHYLYLLVKAPYKDKGYDKPEKNFSVKYRNDIKATLIPYDTSIKQATDNHGITITRFFKKPIPDAEFTAPPGDTFGIQKYAGNEGYYRGRKEYSNTKKLRPDQFEKYEPTVNWEISSMSNLAHLTRLNDSGDENNPDTYGKKKYKYVVSDDYIYLNGDYQNELNADDYEVSKVALNIRVYDYGFYNNNKSIGYHDVKNDEKLNKTMPTTIYGRKSSTGEWEKLATFDYAQDSDYYQSEYDRPKFIQNFKPLIDGVGSYYGYVAEIGFNKSAQGVRIGIPSGYSSVKAEVITNNARIHVLMGVDGKLKRSVRVLKAIEDSKTDKYPLDLTLRNDATLSVYDEDENLVAIKGTSKRDENNSRTLDLDKENYGAEMYHDTAYYNIKVDEILKPKILVDIKKAVADFNDYSFVRLKARNNLKEQRFEIPVAIRQTYRAINVVDSNYLFENYDDKNQGAFYDLLPLGVTSIGDLRLRDDGNEYYESRYIHYYPKYNHEPQIRLVNTTDKSTRNLDFDYELIPNWRDSGRTMLVVKPKNIKKEKASNDPEAQISMMLEYTMYYPWESYEDYGGNIDRNLVGYEVKNFDSSLLLDGTKEEYGGVFDGPKTALYWYHDNGLSASKFFKDNEIPYYENIGDEGSKFVYAQDSTNVSTNTIAVTGLHKHVKAEEDSKYVVETKVKEGGSYSYRMRFVSESGTTTRDLILYDSLENYDPLKSNKYYGKKQWKGTLESIDTSQAKLKGADPKVYVSTIENLNIKKNRDLTDTSVWKPYKEGNDLSKVKAVAVDLTKRPDGSKFELPELQSINTILHMRAPEANKDSLDAMALNQVFANNTPIRKEATVENDLIDQANTAVHLETVETEATIKAKKSYLDKEDKAIELKGDDFEFNLKDSEGKILQTKTNDKDGNITFDPIKYHSWDVGEHTYTIEEVKGKDNKIAYDKHIETVKVKVERPEVSEIKASVEYDKDGSNFINKEKKSASLQLVKLKADEEKFNLEEVKDKDGNLTSYKVPDADLGKTLDGAEYKLYKLNEGKEELVATLTTKNGISNVVEELEAGSYKLVETKAPSGYHLAADALKFEITDEDAGKVLAKFVTDKGIEDLPSTGGRGTKIFIGTGVTLLGLMVGAMYIANKKKKQVTTK